MIVFRQNVSSIFGCVCVCLSIKLDEAVLMYVCKKKLKKLSINTMEFLKKVRETKK